MNKKRNNFIQSPNHNIKITPYWLLGLIEGEGSFFVTKQNLTQHFELGLTSIQKPVLVGIYNFLMSLIPNNMRSIKGLDKPIQLREKSLPENMCFIKISHMTYIRKIFIPFLENWTFFSKKEDSFKDWPAIGWNKIKGKTLNTRRENYLRVSFK
jgi:hypothetical protein